MRIGGFFMKLVLRVLLIGCVFFGGAGCALLPWKKETAAAAETEVAQVEAVREPAAVESPRPKRRKSWMDRILFWKKPPPESAPAQALSPRAKVYFVNQPARLVVLEVASASDLPEGLVLSGLSEGKVSCTVRVAPERRPPFAVGEILTGDPKRGETLYLVEP